MKKIIKLNKNLLKKWHAIFALVSIYSHGEFNYGYRLAATSFAHVEVLVSV